MPVRLGAPAIKGGLQDIVGNPIYATGVGLLHYGMKQEFMQGSSPKSNSGSQVSVLERMKRWFTDNF
jgi:cell division protein FtsA